MAGAGSKMGWKIFGTLSAVAAAVAARKIINVTWHTATGKNPPSNPENPDTTWAEAIGWAVLSGTGVAVARLLATRKAANYWRHSTGALPPGMEEVVV